MEDVERLVEVDTVKELDVEREVLGVADVEVWELDGEDPIDDVGDKDLLITGLEVVMLLVAPLELLLLLVARIEDIGGTVLVLLVACGVVILAAAVDAIDEDLNVLIVTAVVLTLAEERRLVVPVLDAMVAESDVEVLDTDELRRVVKVVFVIRDVESRVLPVSGGKVVAFRVRGVDDSVDVVTLRLLKD